MTDNTGPDVVHTFMLRAFDAALGCPVLEALLRVTDLETLRPLLGEDAVKDSELRYSYLIEPAVLGAITLRFDIAFDPGGRECWLNRMHGIDGLPYLVHTGYELLLILNGVKPFAIFSVEYPTESEDFSHEALFEPHVQSGILIKRVMPDEPFGKPIRSPSGRIFEGARWVFYALKGEEWRIDAHLLVWKQLEHGPWNDTLERLEGSLLGYTDAQNDWWIEHRRSRIARAKLSPIAEQ